MELESKDTEQRMRRFTRSLIPRLSQIQLNKQNTGSNNYTNISRPTRINSARENTTLRGRRSLIPIKKHNAHKLTSGVALNKHSPLPPLGSNSEQQEQTADDKVEAEAVISKGKSLIPVKVNNLSWFKLLRYNQQTQKARSDQIRKLDGNGNVVESHSSKWSTISLIPIRKKRI